MSAKFNPSKKPQKNRVVVPLLVLGGIFASAFIFVMIINDDAEKPDETEEAPIAKPTPRNGPPLALIPGVGISKIRFGATIRGIERRMERPCTIQTESTCLYPKLGLTFELEDGGMAKITSHREGRVLEGTNEKAGRGNATISPRLYAGDPASRIEEAYGKPTLRSKLSGSSGQLERLEYEHLALDLDKLDSGETVIGAIELTRPSGKNLASSHPKSLVPPRAADRGPDNTAD